MEKNSIYQQIKPKRERLRDLIKLYYINHSSNIDTNERITYYPNFVTTINTYRNSKVTWDEHSRTHEYQKSDLFLKLFVSKFDKSREITMKGSFDKLTIVFNPLGVNHFFEKPFSFYSENHFSFFDHFGQSFDELLSLVFDTDHIESKRDLLDEYFDQKYVGFKEERVTLAVNKILESNGNISIQEIADELNISRKTILRLFKKHLNTSPAEYKSIVKFRKALISYQSKRNKPNLSSLAYEADYYDQSDLNFHFKQKTGRTPQQLFKEIETIEKDLYWKIDHVPKVLSKK